MSFDAVTLGQNMIYSYYHKADITITGNGQDILIDVSNGNLLSAYGLEQGGISTTTGVDAAANNRTRTGYIPVSGLSDLIRTVPTGYEVYTTCCYDEDLTFLGVNDTPDPDDVAFIRSMIRKTDDSDFTTAQFNTLKAGAVYCHRYGNSGYHNGSGVSINIASSNIPSGYVCRRWQGEYCVSSDGVNWTAVNAGTKTKLESIYLYDGDNNIRVRNGQEVIIK